MTRITHPITAPVVAVNRAISKTDPSPLNIGRLLTMLLGLGIMGSELSPAALYPQMHSTVQLLTLFFFLTILVGVAPIRLPTFSIWLLVPVAGLTSSVLDSFVVLLLVKAMVDQKRITGDKDQILHLYALMVVAAVIGGLVVWFGEIYAAGTYINDGRTGFLSAAFIAPPVLLFLIILGCLAYPLKVQIHKKPYFAPMQDPKTCRREVFNIIEFIGGIVLLLLTHNPALCLGALLLWAALTSQQQQISDAFKHHTEWDVLLVILICIFAGPTVIAAVDWAGLGEGYLLPIIPSTVQAVLWGPLYHDESVHFWYKIMTLSTGALILPTSSLVGIMLFPQFKQWGTYLKYSIPLAALWYLIMFSWCYVALEAFPAIGNFLDTFAHTGGHH